jgi:hypothetical protein
MPEGSLLARWLVARDLSETEPGAALFKIKTLSEMPRFDGHVVPRRKGRGNPSGQSPLMNAAMVALLFPVPDILPNEDTWIELAVEFLPELRLIHSDIICCLWRVHDGNSYNMTMGFDAFRDRLGRRQRAVDLFHAHFEDRLTARGKAQLRARMRCNEAYQRGSIIGVLTSRAGLMTTLRALSSAHPGTYWVRRRFFGLLSGW